MREGAESILNVGPKPLRVCWVAQHRDVKEGIGFRDVQVRGPFARWVHTHSFEPAADSAMAYLGDTVEYDLPAATLTDPLLAGFAHGELERMFRFRHLRTRLDLERQRAWIGAPRRIAITGATGLVGTALSAFLGTAGHQVLRVTRRPQTADDIGWDPAAGRLDGERLRGVDAVVHLAGESLFAVRWTEAKKHAIRESRVASTRLLAETLARLDGGPRTLLVASAIGAYGDRGKTKLTEKSRLGRGFLADVCRDWEAAAEPARAAGLRVAHLRTGVVMAGRGGALAAMSGPFRLGLGAALGLGQQITSWIALDDLVGAYAFLLEREDLSGVFDATAPAPVTNAELTQTLGRVLGRPTFMRVPAGLLRVATGEMADEMLLASARVLPARLLEAGFEFGFSDLESALRMELGRLRPEDAPVDFEMEP